MGVIELAIGYGREAGQIHVEVVRSAAGEAAADVSLDAGGLLANRKQFEQTLLVSAVSARQVLTASEHLVRDVGKQLFAALLGSGEVAGRYRACVALAADKGEELRIVLRIDSPELAGLPWEAMYDSAAGEYVCRHHQMVRHVPLAATPPPLQVPTPLRVLGVISAPRGLASLDVGKEREQLERALAVPLSKGLADVFWAPPTWSGLHEKLLAEPWHVLHFIGHGDFDSGRDEGVLALTNDDGLPDMVEAARFADLLRQARPMPRLVVLNSCSGAVTGPGDLFSGTAAALARGGVAAVAAMQFAISDSAAVAFARGFYTALALGRGVDESLSAGRIAILGTSGQTLEWITPVLYLRGDDTHLFAMSPSIESLPELKPSTTSELPPESSARIVRESDSVSPLSPIRSLTGHTDAVTGVTFSADGALIATASHDKTARIWDTASGNHIRIITGHDDQLNEVVFNLDASLLATTSFDGTARVWDIASGNLIHTLPDSLLGVAFSPDGTLIVTTNLDGTARVWDSVDGNLLRTFSGHTDAVTGVAFCPDSMLIATTSLDGTVRMWDSVDGNHLRTFTGHLGYVSGVAFNRDGSLIAAGGHDKTARLWDATTGRLVWTLSGHTGYVRGVAFSSKENLLATASDDGTARVWNAGTGNLVRTINGHGSAVYAVAFSPDGAMLATASRDKVALIWALSLS